MENKKKILVWKNTGRAVLIAILTSLRPPLDQDHISTQTKFLAPHRGICHEQSQSRGNGVTVITDGCRPGLIFSRDGSVWVASGDPRVRRWPNAYVRREAGRCYDSHMWRGGMRWKANCLGFVCLRWASIGDPWVL